MYNIESLLALSPWKESFFLNNTFNYIWKRDAENEH